MAISPIPFFLARRRFAAQSLVEKSASFQLVENALINQSIQIHFADLWIAQFHEALNIPQPVDNDKSLSVRAPDVVLISIIGCHRVRNPELLCNNLNYRCLVGRIQDKSMAFDERPQCVTRDGLVACKVIALHNDGGTHQRTLLYSPAEIVARAFKPLAKNPRERRSLDSPRFQGLGNDALVTEGCK